MVRSDALKKAQEKYEAHGRQGVPVSTRLDPDTELKALDQARGDQSRSAFVKEAVLKLIQERMG